MVHQFAPHDFQLPRKLLPRTELRASIAALGTSSFGTLDRARAVFDRYHAFGGNFFDTAHVYGESFDPGCCERTLGTWMASAAPRESFVLLGKGGHPPRTTPEGLRSDLEESLARLNTDYIDIHMMHRDDPGVPVGEFVDALCALQGSGRIRAYGFSNWTLERTQAAWHYAHSRALPLPCAISNQLSLAVMMKPIYPGCESASSHEFREWLTSSGCALVPWSSQGRGVFTAAENPEDLFASALAECWYSADNVERIKRARTLAARHSVLPVNIALAWVLHQAFPVFPIIGPRTVTELESSMKAFRVALNHNECAWLNLET